MTLPISGQNAQPVSVVTDEVTIGAPAFPVYGYDSVPTDRGVLAGAALRVKVLSASDLLENGGRYVLQGSPIAVPVYSVPAEYPVQGNVAIAVYPINNWPDPAPPVTNWWEAGGATGTVQVLQPKGAASYAASLLDLSGNGNNASEGAAPTWDTVDGWTFSGTPADTFLDTGIVPASGWTMVVRFSNGGVTTGTMIVAGLGSGTPSRFFLDTCEDTTNHVYGAGGFTVVANRITSGVMAIAGQQGYLDGVADGAAASGSGWTTTRSVYIGGNNNGGLRNATYAGNVQAIAIYDNTLDAATVAAVSAAMAAL